MVVNDGLGLLDRGLAGEDACAQTRGHGNEADGFQVRVQVGGRAAGGLGRSQAWAATTSITAAEFLTRGAIASAGSVSESAK